MPVKQAKESSRKGKLAWVLSPGLLRGWLQFGVMDRLLAMGLEPDLIVGSSVGSYVGIVPATKTPIVFVEKADDEYDLSIVLEKGFFNHGIFSSNKGMNLLKKNFARINTFEDLTIPLIAVATDRQTGKSVAFSTGDLWKAIAASISHPFLFPPVYINGSYYIDGGISNPAPIDIAIANGATHVIFIDSYTEVFSRNHQREVKEFSRVIRYFLKIMPHNELPHIGKLYTIIKSLLIAKPTFKEAVVWYHFLQNSLIEKSVALYKKQTLHLNLSHALDGDTKVPLSNHSFKNGSHFIEKGRNAVETYMNDLQHLKSELQSAKSS